MDGMALRLRETSIFLNVIINNLCHTFILVKIRVFILYHSGSISYLSINLTASLFIYRVIYLTTTKLQYFVIRDSNQNL